MKPFKDPTFFIPEWERRPVCKHECRLCEKHPRLTEDQLHVHVCKKCGKSYLNEAS